MYSLSRATNKAGPPIDQHGYFKHGPERRRRLGRVGAAQPFQRQHAGVPQCIGGERAERQLFERNHPGRESPLLNLTSPQSGSIQIEGSDSNWYSVSVNLNTDSLQTIANNITSAAIPGVTASVVPTTTSGATTYQLQITNTAGSSPPSMKDSNSILDTPGIYGGTVKNVLQAGQNANLSVDGYNVTSASNTVTGVINGVTLNLTGTNPTTAINLNITADNLWPSSQVSTLVTDINTALAFINSQNTVNSFVRFRHGECPHGEREPVHHEKHDSEYPARVIYRATARTRPPDRSGSISGATAR